MLTAREKHGVRPFDPAAYLNDENEMAQYLALCIEDGDMDLFFSALDDVIRARGIAEVSRLTGLGRESLYKTFRPERKPQFVTVLKVLEALGVGMGFHARSPSRPASPPAKKTTKAVPRKNRRAVTHA